jgi:hypothetical protein
MHIQHAGLFAASDESGASIDPGGEPRRPESEQKETKGTKEDGEIRRCSSFPSFPSFENPALRRIDDF